MTKIICIGGKAQNGKDTSAIMINNELQLSGKRTVIAHYGALVKFICEKYFNWDGKKDVTGRSILQRVGTDVVRNQFPDYWVDFVVGVVNMFPDEWDYVIIPDTRFPNELEKWKNANYDVIHIRVERKNFKSPLTEEQLKHVSETALDDSIPNYIIVNDGTLEELRTKIRNLCKEI